MNDETWCTVSSQRSPWLRALGLLLLAVLLSACGSSGSSDSPDADVVGDVEADADEVTPDPDVLPDTHDPEVDTSPDIDPDPDASDTDAPGPDAVDPDVVDPPDPGTWQLLLQDVPEALLSVQGSASDDVWVVGADQGRGPLVLHFDGEGWTRHETDLSGHLWWVFPLEDGTVYFGGSAGMVARYQDGHFERMNTPGLGRHTVYGVWGRSADDVYAVGSVSGHSGFVWHYDGTSWRELPLPRAMPRLGHGGTAGLFKVWGDAESAWFVGAMGTMLRRTGDGPLELVPTGTQATLFTVFGDAEAVYAVGGGLEGEVIAAFPDGRVVVESPQDAPLLQGVCVGVGGAVWASGAYGALYERVDGAWVEVDVPLVLPVESWHAVWVDENDGVWAVGGNVLTPALDEGALLVRRPETATPEVGTLEPPVVTTTCPEGEVARWLDRSMARQWNEQVLAAIRRDVPMPGVHARNLYHLSALLWDAWAAYEPDALGLFYTDKIALPEAARRAAQEEAMSYAAFRLLRHRYQNSRGRLVTYSCLDTMMTLHGFDPDFVSTAGDSPAALGNRLAEQLIAHGMQDGALEHQGYLDPTHYISPNPVLFVDEPGIDVVDPDAWQYLDISVAETQNGLPLTDTRQPYIGPHWGDVVPFALQRPAPGAPYFDLAPGPRFSDPAMVDWVVQVLDLSRRMDIESGVMIDISPGAYGNNPLGSDESPGHPVNPITGEPYAPNMVLEGDFGRVLAEYWADGPDSETPPGHWNVLANRLVDNPLFQRRLYGQGPELDPLHWDLLVYLTLNGAVHDAAIAAWEVKRLFVTSRPITLVRYMGTRGQSSDPGLPSYHPHGLPLIDGLIELITEESSAPGERHELLRPFVGDVAIFNWPGEPGDRTTQRASVRWMRAAEWITYQRRTFVTPAFPGFVSGHSTFSRSAAEVLTALTGSPYFPGGLGEFVARRNAYLHFEQGPSQEVRLQWATYYDAADQAGQSRIWGGIHIKPDDFDGRRIGHQIGLGALAFMEARLAFFQQGE